MVGEKRWFAILGLGGDARGDEKQSLFFYGLTTAPFGSSGFGLPHLMHVCQLVRNICDRDGKVLAPKIMFQ